MFKQTIRVNILIIFILLVSLVSASLLTSQYYFNKKLAMDSTEKTFQLISSNISNHIYKSGQRIKNILKANKDNKRFINDINFTVNHNALKDFQQIMKINNNISSTYIVHKDASFYQVVNMKISPLLHKLYNAPKDTRWMIIIKKESKILHAFLNSKNELLLKRFVNKKFNPLSRPWYKSAIKTKDVKSTEPYMFSNLKQNGITYSIQINQEGSVFAIDYTMQNINKLLAVQELDDDSEIFIFNKNGNKLASSKKTDQSIHDTVLDISTSKTLLTQEEQIYIDTLPTLRVSNNYNSAPFDFQSFGQPMGYSIDLLKLISKKSGLNIEFTNGSSWSEFIEMFQNKDLEIIHTIYKTTKREEQGNFTHAIYNFKNYFITQKKSPVIQKITDLKDKKTAIIKGRFLSSYLQKKYPDVIQVLFDDVASAYSALTKGEVDAIIDIKESYSYLSNQLYIDNIKIDSWFKEFDNNRVRPVYIMLPKESPLLLSIFNKSISELNKTGIELQKLHNKWFVNNLQDNQIDMIDNKLMKAFLKTQDMKIIRYSIDSNNYFTIYRSIANSDIYIAVKINTFNLLKLYNENIKYSFTIALILLLLSLPVILIATNYIIKPIKALTIENEKIKNRDFANVKVIQTNIVEFIELSNSFSNMSHSIQEYQKSQAELLDSIVKLIAEAVDAKSPYTGGHCERVPEIAQMMVDEANLCKDGVFKDFILESEDDLREFQIGSWLHDCGKVTTPEYVVDKSTKLETINDRIHEIRTRFEVLWRDAQIEYLQAQLDNRDKTESLELLNLKQTKLINDFTFIANANIGGEFMSEDKQLRVKEIAQQEWQRNFDDSLGLGELERLRYEQDSVQTLPATEKLLSDKKQHLIQRENFDYESYERDGFKEMVPEYLYNYGEVYNLCIAKGTLSPEERYKINEHVILTIKMLEKIPFPSQMTKIPEYAGTHHETLIGTGYPRKLTKDDLSIPARIMAVADVFEALTASDRPYKKAKTLSESVKILSFMVKDEHLDADIFKLFLKSDLHNVYARKYLKEEQIDEVDIEKYL